VSGEIIGGFYETCNELGSGFSEPIYTRALDIVLRGRGLDVQREYPIVVNFRGQQIGFHRCDMLIERCVIVEIKASDLLAPVAKEPITELPSSHPPRAWDASPLRPTSQLLSNPWSS